MDDQRIPCGDCGQALAEADFGQGTAGRYIRFQTVRERPICSCCWQERQLVLRMDPHRARQLALELGDDDDHA